MPPGPRAGSWRVQARSLTRAAPISLSTEDPKAGEERRRCLRRAIGLGAVSGRFRRVVHVDQRPSPQIRRPCDLRRVRLRRPLQDEPSSNRTQRFGVWACVRTVETTAAGYEANASASKSRSSYQGTVARTRASVRILTLDMQIGGQLRVEAGAAEVGDRPCVEVDPDVQRVPLVDVEGSATSSAVFVVDRIIRTFSRLACRCTTIARSAPSPRPRCAARCRPCRRPRAAARRGAPGAAWRARRSLHAVRRSAALADRDRLARAHVGRDGAEAARQILDARVFAEQSMDGVREDARVEQPCRG